MLIALLTISLVIIFRRAPEPKSAAIANMFTPIDSSTTTPQPKNKAALRDSIIKFGMTYLGTKYVEGSCSKDGFDCSGFVYFVFQHFKVQVPRSSIQFKNFGRAVSIDSVRKGDVLVFLSPTRNVIGHVGIVTEPKGMETAFIHASSGKEKKVIISSLKQENYTRRFVKAVNVL